ncbi:hypothetical protein BM547_05260 [Pseudomonas aeruginosa]|uniref:hypothetical protein n=1 Tax=Pseudomonas aeruginosa TaxID=287 RepID=UPI0009C8839F|nr:hypothetical protein [Pseudomonas aeruginosa]OOK60222.1 hypothetical protein BM547_05260 [Pseudomonas aeruginosa]
MTESKICTCPSGDGSLRHPCPAHPASVELAGVAANLTFINGRPAMCGCQVEYSSGGGEYSDVIYVTLCAKHSGSAILDLVATNRIALTPEYEGQWHADLYLDREIPLAKAEGATPAEAVLALMSAERIDPEQGGVDQAGGDRWDALQSIMEWTAAENIPDDRKLCLIRNAARAALAQPSPKCATCGGTGMVDDGEIDCYSDGTPFENGPVKCVKDCPACKAQPSPLQAEQPTADDYEEVLADHRRLVRELDVLLNGEEGAAKQASLCDLVGQVAAIVRERRAPLLSPAQAGQVPDAQAVYDAFDSRERMFTSYENVSVVLAAQKRIAAAPSQAQHSVPEGLAEFSQFLSAVMDAAGLVRYGRRSKELSEYLGAQCMKYRLSAPVAQAGQVPAAWYYDAPSQAEAAIIDIRGMWGEDDCPTYEDVAAALRRLLAAAPGKEVPQAWLDVQAERRRQVEVEGYHGFRDNHYISYELSKAARAYIEVSWHALSGGLPCKKPESWPWMAGFKWSDGRTMLVKACALALAEIERLDRAAHGKEEV